MILPISPFFCSGQLLHVPQGSIQITSSQVQTLFQLPQLCLELSAFIDLCVYYTCGNYQFRQHGCFPFVLPVFVIYFSFSPPTPVESLGYTPFTKCDRQYFLDNCYTSPFSSFPCSLLSLGHSISFLLYFGSKFLSAFPISIQAHLLILPD